MPRCVSFITIADHGFESWLDPHHQYDYECHSTGADIARLYFRMAISVYADMQFAMALLYYRFIIPYSLLHGPRQSPVGKAAEGQNTKATTRYSFTDFLA